MIEITHTAAEGTLVEGTSRGDGTNVVLKQAGFRWFRTLGMWGIPGSRDRQPNVYKIERAAEALRAAGFDVQVAVDASHRPAAEAEADLAQRQEARADALADKADRRAGAADAAWQAHDNACAVLPPGGEPIHVGHHSERRHRNAIDKAWNKLGKAVEASAASEETARRAEVAAKAGAYRHNPVTVKNRIDKFEAEQRKDQRQLDGYRRVVARAQNGTEYADESAPATGAYRERIAARMAQRADEITYWNGIYAELQAAGVANQYSKDTIQVGDSVLYLNTWWEVVRANAKSVSVRYFDAATWTSTIGYHKLRGHRPAEKKTKELDTHPASPD